MLPLNGGLLHKYPRALYELRSNDCENSEVGTVIFVEYIVHDMTWEYRQATIFFRP